MAFGGAERGHVGLDSLLADEAIGIETAFEGDDLDLEAFLGQQRDAALGCGCAGCIGVEVDDRALGEAAEETNLHLGEGGSGESHRRCGFLPCRRRCSPSALRPGGQSHGLACRSSPCRG